MYKNHYEYLEEHLPQFLENVEVKGGWELNGGIISAHGDKAYYYRDKWEKNGIYFYHGVSIYLLTYCAPYAKEVRQTKDPSDWVVENAHRFLPYLPTTS
jgi:hypothetical protein